MFFALPQLEYESYEHHGDGVDVINTTVDKWWKFYHAILRYFLQNEYLKHHQDLSTCNNDIDVTIVTREFRRYWTFCWKMIMYHAVTFNSLQEFNDVSAKMSVAIDWKY